MKYFTFICMLFFCIAAFGQKTSLPKKVDKTFNKKFPGVEEVKWNVDKRDYKIRFTYNGKKTIAEIDPDGTWERTTTHITFEELPQPVQNTLNEVKKDAAVDEIKSVEDNKKGSYYRIDLVENNVKTKLWIGTDGKMIKTETDD